MGRNGPSASQPNSANTPMAAEESHLNDALLDRWKYEDETLAQRTDWFLIFHAILLEAFFAAVSPSHLRQLPIALFGFLAGFLWLISRVASDSAGIAAHPHSSKTE